MTAGDANPPTKAQMQAVAFARYGGPEVLQVRVLPVPEPHGAEVRVRVRASTVNPIDWKIRRGKMRLVMPAHFPRIGGWDLAGEVDKVGPRVTGLAPGDAVMGIADPRGNGAHADFCVVAARFLVQKPPALSYAQAAALMGSGITALQMVREQGRTKAGERVLVIGASGGVGHLAVQVAKADGARVAAVCSARNEGFVTDLGAEAVFPYDRGPIPAGERFDVILDTVKAGAYLALTRHLEPRGRYVATMPDVGGLAVSWLLLPFGSGRRCRFVMAFPTRARLAALVALAEAGKVLPVIDRTFPLAAVAEAHALSEAGHVRGKLVVQVAPEA
jgi:NADPH:quinone reductase-like Zn-dependent oxidoreductase